MELTLHWQGEKKTVRPVQSFAEASSEFARSRNDGCYGASCMMATCGRLTENGVTVGYVSYNGRVWRGTPRQWTITQEPLYTPEATCRP